MKKKLLVSAASWLCVLTVVTGQDLDLNFQGLLTDIQGNSFGDDQFELTVHVMPASGDEVLYEFTSPAHTDSYGWFGFTISGVSRFLTEGGQLSKPVVIKLNFLPNDNTKWIRKGEDFMVTYTLTPKSDAMGTEFTITRMEGSELDVFSEAKLYAFKDQYPFAYLSGGFLVTQDPPGDQTISDLKHWISPDNQGSDEPASRGVKGGFPVGGYYKKN